MMERERDRKTERDRESMLSEKKMVEGLFGGSTCGGGLAEGRASSLEQMSSVAFGTQVPFEFVWQMETVTERLQQENPNLTQRLG